MKKKNLGKGLAVGLLVGAIGFGSMFSFADSGNQPRNNPNNNYNENYGQHREYHRNYNERYDRNYDYLNDEDYIKESRKYRDEEIDAAVKDGAMTKDDGTYWRNHYKKVDKDIKDGKYIPRGGCGIGHGNCGNGYQRHNTNRPMGHGRHHR